MPPKHQSTKNHKRLNIIKIALVEFSVLELWSQVFLLTGVVSKFKYSGYIIFSLLFYVIISCSGPDSESKGFLSFSDNKENNRCLVNYARGFDISYQKNYTVLTVYNPWQGADNIAEKYYLVNRNEKIPRNIEGKTIIYVPISRIVCMSTTHIALVDYIGKTNTIVGVSGSKYVNNREIKNLIDQKKVCDLGYDNSLNYELLISLKPDIVMAYGIESNISEMVNKLKELGITVVINGEYLEENPLGKAEWIKFVSAFYKEENNACLEFDKIKKQYFDLKELTMSVSEKPRILTGLPWNDVWYVPGGRSYAVQLISDAGGEYLWNTNDSRESLALSIESVFEEGKNADIWINTGDADSGHDILANDERLIHLKAFQQQALYNNNAKHNNSGGNDYWESGIVNPQFILKDLISIFHPELLPGHKLVYYKKLSN
jgi:iron complex transport system substrate-binding protein